MRKAFKFDTAAVALACAFAATAAPAPRALAQSPEARAWKQSPEARKPGEAVRVRRVEPGPASPGAPRAGGAASGAEGAAAREESGKSEAVKSEAKAETDDAEKAETVDAGKAETADAELEALRARAEAAATPAERGRLRQAVAERLAEAGQRTEAVELLRALLAEERFDPALFYNAGNSLARLGESDAAADAYRKAIAQRRGNYARAQHNLGVVLTRLGRWEEAEEALQAALKLESHTYAEASYSLGRLHALRGETGLAAAEWSRTLRLKPEHADAAAALARSLAETGDARQALAVLDAFSERAARAGRAVPREVTVARGEIQAAANVEREGRAAPRGGGTTETRDPNETRNAPGPRGLSGARAGEDSGAGAYAGGPAGPALPPDTTALLRGARAADGGRGPFVANRRAFPLLLDARVARAGSRYEEAASLYRRAIAQSGGYLAPANLELGLTLISLRQNEEAAANLLAVVRREGARYPLVFYHLGRIYEHLDRLGEAGEAYARAAELAGEGSPQFYLDLSRVREREGRAAEALAAAERYLSGLARTGVTADWARERVEALRRQAARPSHAKQ